MTFIHPIEHFRLRRIAGLGMAASMALIALVAFLVSLF